MGASSCKAEKKYDEFLLIWCNFNFEGVLLRSDSRHNDRVDSLTVCVGLPDLHPPGVSG